MNQANKERFIVVARNISKNYATTTSQQIAIKSIYELFTDGKYHTCKEVALLTGYSLKYTNQQIMPLLKQAWGLVSHKTKGYCMIDGRPK